MNQADWKPSFRWHINFLTSVVAVCFLLFLLFSYLTAHLPAPYQIHRPAPQAMPWNAHSMEDL